MKKGRVNGKTLCVIITFLIIATIFSGLPSTMHAVQASTLADGKGMWIWKIWELGESVSQIIDKLEFAGVEWVAVKCGDSDSYWLSPSRLMYDWLITNGYGDFGEVVTQFHNAGVKVFGWHYVYSYDRWAVSGVTEADVSNQILDILGINGLIIDAEAEYEGEDKGPIAEAYMIEIRNSHPSDFVAYSTFPIIDYHLWFPYIEFGRYCDAVMPQAYWKEIGVTPTEMVNWMNEQWDKWHETWKNAGYYDSVKPLIPVGQGDVSGSEITEFCELVLSRYEGISLWRYGIMTSGAWTAYAAIGGNPPDQPATTNQFKSDRTTVIPEGGTTSESTVVFRGTVSDPDGDQVRLEIELRQISEVFTGEPTPETISDFVSSGTEVNITRYGLVNGDYHWQYRAKDADGATSDWTEFGVSGNIDFTVSLNDPPQLSDGTVEPETGDTSTDFYYYVTYFDPDGDEPSVKQVYIDGIAHTMSWHSASDSWITYRYGPKNLPAGSHLYYFYFEDGRGGAARLPTSGSYHDPTVKSRDVAITAVTPSKTTVGQGYSLSINVTLHNQGECTESFNVTAYANATEIGRQELTLPPTGSTTITFPWDTTGVAKGNYTIKAEATPVPGEIDTADNTFDDGWVVVTIPGDIDGDYDVDYKDLFILARAYGCSRGDECYVPNADLDCNGIIDYKDLFILARHYGQEDP